MLVYDVTNKESFENLKNVWYKLIKENCKGKYMIYVLGNKAGEGLDIEVEYNEVEEWFVTILIDS